MDHQSYQPEIMENMQRKIAAWLEEQSLEEPIEYLCRIAHLRAEAFVQKESA